MNAEVKVSLWTQFPRSNVIGISVLELLQYVALYHGGEVCFFFQCPFFLLVLELLQFVALYHGGLYIYFFSKNKIRLKAMWPLPRASAKPFLRLPRRCTGNFLFCSSSILTFFLGSFFYFLKQSWDVFRKTNTSLARDSAWDVIKNYVDVFCLFLCSFSLLFFLGRHAAIYVTCTERRSRGKACGT